MISHCGAEWVDSFMGRIEQMVRLNIAGLSTSHPMSDSLAEMAYGLAHTLDRGAGLLQPSLNRELRATLADLVNSTRGEDDDLSDMLSEVRDPSQG
jgi:hypothetical protein